MVKNNIKVTIIGCGTIAEFHIKALRSIDGVELIGVYDGNEERCKSFGLKHNIKVFSCIEDVWNSNCELVSICTPSGTHAQLAISALSVGKNVVIEKPLALTYSDCLKIMEAEKSSGRFCAPISQLRFSDSVIAVKKAVDDGLLGKVTVVDLSMKYYRSEAYYENSWRGTFAMDGGGALMNQGIHGLDVMRFICLSSPVAVPITTS